MSLTKIEVDADRPGVLTVDGVAIDQTILRVVVALLSKDAPEMLPDVSNYMLSIKLVRSAGLLLAPSKSVVDFLRGASVHYPGNFEASHESRIAAYHMFN